jgi:cation transport ATPase
VGGVQVAQDTVLLNVAIKLGVTIKVGEILDQLSDADFFFFRKTYI